MKRGDIVTIAVAGDYGKPRPAVIIQSNLMTESDAQSIILCLITSQLADVKTFRLNLSPTATNGLLKPSQIMIDKIFTAPRVKTGKIIGSLTKRQQQELNRKLTFVVGLA